MSSSSSVRRPKAKLTPWGKKSSRAMSSRLMPTATWKDWRRVQRMLSLLRSPWKVLTMGCRAMLMAS